MYSAHPLNTSPIQMEHVRTQTWEQAGWEVEAPPERAAMPWFQPIAARPSPIPCVIKYFHEKLKSLYFIFASNAQRKQKTMWAKPNRSARDHFTMSGGQWSKGSGPLGSMASTETWTHQVVPNPNLSNPETPALVQATSCLTCIATAEQPGPPTASWASPSSKPTTSYYNDLYGSLVYGCICRA